MNETKDRAGKWLIKGRENRKLASILLPAIVMAGCAGLDNGSQTPEQRVEQRAQAHLDALLEWDLDKAMTFTSPAYRERTTRNEYGAKYAGVGNWSAARVKEVACEEERCDVTILATYDMRRLKIKNTRPLDQVWIKVGKEWYIYHK